MPNGQFDEERPAAKSSESLRRRHDRLLRNIRGNPFWIWLLLIFVWYGAHGYFAAPTMPWSEIDMGRFLLLMILIGLWPVAWASWWIWVWPIAILATLAAAFLLAMLAAIAVSLGGVPPDQMDSLVRTLLTIIVLWTVAMNVLGAGVAMSLKRRFRPRPTFWILLVTAWAGLGTGWCLGLVIR